jgi:transcriptional regulator with XRE-family HTH domain
MTIGERLLTQRKKRGMTQAELAKTAKVSQGLIARIERGQVKDPASSVSRRLAQALSVTADWLVGMYDDEPDEFLMTAGALV